MLLLPDIVRYSIYAIVSQTRITRSFLKREQRQLAHPTVQPSYFAAMQFRRCVWSRLDATRRDATRRDGTRRDAPIKSVDPKRIPYLAPISIFTKSRSRIYVSIPRVRSGSGGENGNGRRITGLSRIRSWARFVWREARPTYPIRFHHWVGSFPGCQYLQYLTKLIQL